MATHELHLPGGNRYRSPTPSVSSYLRPLVRDLCLHLAAGLTALAAYLGRPDQT